MVEHCDKDDRLNGAEDPIGKAGTGITTGEAEESDGGAAKEDGKLIGGEEERIEGASGGENGVQERCRGGECRGEWKMVYYRR